VGIEIKLLEDETGFGPETGQVGLGIMDLHSINNYFTVVNGFQFVDTANQGTFPGAAGSAYHTDTARQDMEINIFENMERSVPFVNFIKPNHL